MTFFDHVCDQCFASMFDHLERCYDDSHGDDLPGYHSPPLCCPGCGCKSYEEAHGLVWDDQAWLREDDDQGG